MAKRDKNGDLLQPIEFYRNAEGVPVVMKGSRRVRALRLLADRGVPGFGKTMSIRAKEVPPPAGKDRGDVATDGH